MDVYGLTGGIGSGKSTVAELLEEYGVPVVSADELSRIVVSRGSDGLADVVSLFGPGVLDENGDLDRRKMAAIIFQDPAKRRELEAILHPRIRERYEQVLDALEKAGHEVAVYEVPLLFEKNLQGEMKAVILVTANEAARTERVRARDDVTETEVRARMAAQMDEAAKRKKADYIIENDGSMDDLRREVEFLLSRFLRVSTRAGPSMPPLEDDTPSDGALSGPRTQVPTTAPGVPTTVAFGKSVPLTGGTLPPTAPPLPTRGGTLPPGTHPAIDPQTGWPRKGGTLPPTPVSETAPTLISTSAPPPAPPSAPTPARDADAQPPAGQPHPQPPPPPPPPATPGPSRPASSQRPAPSRPPPAPDRPVPSAPPPPTVTSAGGQTNGLGPPPPPRGTRKPRRTEPMTSVPSRAAPRPPPSELAPTVPDPDPEEED